MSPKRILNYYVDLSYLPKCTERFLDCVVQENIHIPSLPPPPTEGTFALNLHPHGVPIPRCACYTPTPQNFRDFPSWLGTPCKNTVALYHYAKYDCSCNKVRKNIFIHVSKLAS